MPIKIIPIRVYGDVAYVPLTQGYTAIIDAADVPLVEGWNWYALVKPRSVYVMRQDCSGTNPRTVYMHRVLMGSPKGLDVDHLDGDGLNNMRGNLRTATRLQNLHNMRKSRRNKSGFKGVCWDKGANKWKAQIMLNYKQNHLGLFNSPEKAHAAYCRASEKYHGEFGRTE
jgi:hypothetical protein